MLRSLTEELRIVVTPECVGALRMVLGRPAGDVKVRDSSGEASGWGRVAASLVQLKQDFPESRGAQGSVILSDHFVRYLVLPWQDALSGADEWQAYARQAFISAYGATAGDWRLSVSMHRFGTPLVAAAIDEAIAGGVASAVASMGLKLKSMEPHFMRVFNRYRRRFATRDFWLVTHEGGRLCLAKVDQGAWAGLSSRQLSAGDASESAVCLLREMAKFPADVANKSVYIHASRNVAKAFEQAIGDAAKVTVLADGDFPGPGGEIRRLALC